MKALLVDLLVKKTGVTKESVASLLERPKQAEHGDWSFPCFTLSQTYKKNPVEIAREIARTLPLPTFLEKIEAVGPYINFFLNTTLLARQTLTRILREKERYGRSSQGRGKRVMIEYSQPNTHKAFHIGHIRGTSFGESLARLKEWGGYAVIRANYSGDTGMHIAKWLWAYRTFHARERIQNSESWFANLYVEAVQKLEGDERAAEEVAVINRALDAHSDAALIKLWKQTRLKSIAAWKPLYRDLDVTFNVHFFESQVEAAGKRIAQSLVARGLATISDDATIMDLTSHGLGIWVLLRRDGTVLYSAKDLALAEIKFKRYHTRESLVITSVEQNLHFKQLCKTLALMKFPHADAYRHVGYESVRLPEGKMSSRTGTNILYADFKEELIAQAREEIAKREKLSKKEMQRRALAIALAALKYSMLKQDSTRVLIFDKEEALRFDGDTGPYLLYSYARARSILRKAPQKASSKMPLALEPAERALISELARFPTLVHEAAHQYAPPLIAHYAFAIAQTFNEFYHSEKVIGSEREAFRLLLVKAFAYTLKNALTVLGIRVLEKM